MKKLLSIVLMLVMTAVPCFAAMPMETAFKVVDYRNNAHKTPNSNAWGEAMYQKGNMAVYADCRSEKYLTYSLDWAERANYSVDTAAPAPKALLAADVYAELYSESRNEKLFNAAKEAAEAITEESCESIEAIYMSLPLLGKMYGITGNKEYLTKMEQCYAHLKDTLYDEKTQLFWENSETVGKNFYWSRGNGFALSGLADIIELLPEGEFADKLRKDYKTVAEAVFDCRTEEGYYTRSLTEHELYPGFETGGTAYIIYGLAKGINMGMLNKEAYAASINDGFDCIAAAVKDSGQVGFVQSRDSSGGEKGVALDGSATGGYATGAVMLAGIETEKMNSGLTSDMAMLRPYAEKRGYSVEYHAEDRSVVIIGDGLNLTLNSEKGIAVVNGKEITLSAKGILFNDRTYIKKEDIKSIFEK